MRTPLALLRQFLVFSHNLVTEYFQIFVRVDRYQQFSDIGLRRLMRSANIYPVSEETLSDLVQDGHVSELAELYQIGVRVLQSAHFTLWHFLELSNWDRQKLVSAYSNKSIGFVYLFEYPWDSGVGRFAPKPFAVLLRIFFKHVKNIKDMLHLYLLINDII